MREFVFSVPDEQLGECVEVPVPAENVTEARRILTEWFNGAIDADLYEPQCVEPERAG